MTNIQKMLEALECHFKPIGEENCLECLYSCSKASWTNIQDQLCLDLIEFLKEQIPRIVTEKDFDKADANGYIPVWCEVLEKDGTIVELGYTTIRKEAFNRVSFNRFWTSCPSEEQRKVTSWN